MPVALIVGLSRSINKARLADRGYKWSALFVKARASKQSILCTNITAVQLVQMGRWLRLYGWLSCASPPPPQTEAQRRHRLQACGIDFGGPFSHALVHGRVHSCPLPQGLRWWMSQRWRGVPRARACVLSAQSMWRVFARPLVLRCFNFMNAGSLRRFLNPACATTACFCAWMAQTERRSMWVHPPSSSLLFMTRNGGPLYKYIYIERRDRSDSPAAWSDPDTLDIDPARMKTSTTMPRFHAGVQAACDHFPRVTWLSQRRVFHRFTALVAIRVCEA